LSHLVRKITLTFRPFGLIAKPLESGHQKVAGSRCIRSLHHDGDHWLGRSVPFYLEHRLIAQRDLTKHIGFGLLVAACHTGGQHHQLGNMIVFFMTRRLDAEPGFRRAGGASADRPPV